MYISNASAGLKFDELAALTERSAAYRQTDGLTGILISLEDSFFGLLEGDHERTLTAIDRLENSPHHSGMITLSRRLTSEPMYSDWSVGFRFKPPPDASPYIFHAPDVQSVLARTVVQPDIELDVFLHSFYQSNTR